MLSDLSSEETIVITVYSNRHDAEVAGSVLADHGIESAVAADDVHPPLQVTEGSRLLVLRRDADEAYRVLTDAGLLPASGSDAPASESGETAAPAADRPTRLTAGAYLVVVILILVAVIAGLLFA